MKIKKPNIVYYETEKSFGLHFPGGIDAELLSKMWKKACKELDQEKTKQSKKLIAKV